jgi:hypothetical protein
MFIGSLIMPNDMSELLTTPLFLISSRMANVRINKFVQNGMVIRNNQIFRVFGGRVAIKYAVGKPSIRQINVVRKES